MRSWLAGVTSVLELGKIGLAFRDNQDPDDGRRLDLYNEYPKHTPCSERDAVFFNCNLQDSWRLHPNLMKSESDSSVTGPISSSTG